MDVALNGYENQHFLKVLSLKSLNFDYLSLDKNNMKLHTHTFFIHISNKELEETRQGHR